MSMLLCFAVVANSDFIKMLLMIYIHGAGLIEEYDTPTRLLENSSSSFAQLVAEYSSRSKSSFEK